MLCKLHLISDSFSSVLMDAAGSWSVGFFVFFARVLTYVCEECMCASSYETHGNSHQFQFTEELLSLLQLALKTFQAAFPKNPC